MPQQKNASLSANKSASSATAWLDPENLRHEAFGDGKLWIGQHAGDMDILVFDPSAADANAEVLSLYSLTQHRTRAFPRATVHERIAELTDKAARARAMEEYARRDTLRAAHEQALADEHALRRDRQRDAIIDAHRHHLETLGLDYDGVQETGERRSGRVLKCHRCGIVLDDFVGVKCLTCSGVLCSCGACACGKQPSGR
jgi:hypothetical protein